MNAGLRLPSLSSVYRYFTRSTRTLSLQPCTYISQLPSIIGLIVTVGLVVVGQE